MTSITLSPQIPPNVAAFIRSFYTVTDDSTKHDEYVAHFASGKEEGGDGVSFQIGAMKPATTREGIRAWRTASWVRAATRTHHIYDAYPPPGASAASLGEGAGGSYECLIRGWVGQELKAGGEIGGKWGARMVLVEDKDKKGKEGGDDGKGGLVLQNYEVWLTWDHDIK